MGLPTINDVQAYDPVLTNMLIGYMQADDRFVASRVFPNVPVEKDSGTYFTFDKKYWFLDQMQERAPGDDYARSGFGASTSTYKTLQWALAFTLAAEVRANSQIPMDLESAAVRWLGQQNLIRIERSFATDFFTTSVWGTTDNNATTDWDDFAAGDPVSDINTAVRTISNETGVKANSLVLGFIVDDALRNHPDILDRIKYVQVASAGNVTAALADIFGLQNYWPAISSFNSANEGAASGTYAAIIDDDALVCFVDPGAGVFGATAGKTFSWLPGGGDGLIGRTREDANDRDLIKMKAQWDQVATATDVGYIFLDVV